MATIRLLRNTVCAGQAVNAGAVVETDERSASLLISLGKAEAVDAPPPEPHMDGLIAPPTPPTWKGKKK